MPLKLMYITNRTDVAEIAESVGVDRIFTDLEYIGKSLRQGGMDTVQNHHTPEDVKRIKNTLKKAELLARVNPVHNESADYTSTEEEVDAVISSGADIIMLPYFKTADEVKRFITAVDKRAKTVLLFETPESVNNINEIMSQNGIDEVYVGLNDLSLGMGKKFMFELLADGTVDRITAEFKKKNIPFGFGGIAALGKGLLPAEYVIAEHYRLNSGSAILSRSFCNPESGIGEIREVFERETKRIREYEKLCERMTGSEFAENRNNLRKIVDKIIKN